MADLKQCINLISANAPFPGCREDFPTEEAYREWRSSELSELQQMMLAMIKMSPELVRNESQQSDSTTSSMGASTNGGGGGGGAPPMSPVFEAGEAYIGTRSSLTTKTPIAEQFATSLYFDNKDITTGGVISPVPSTSSTTDDNIPEDGGFTFIPSDVRHAYQRLLELMLSHDLEAMADLDPSEEVPLRILSRLNTDLLSECITRWRVMPTYRFITFLKDMNKRYTAGEMPVLECVLEALSDFTKIDEEVMSWKKWPVQDLQDTKNEFSNIFDTLLRAFYETFSEQNEQDGNAQSQSPEQVRSIVEAAENLSRIPVFDEAINQNDLDDRFEELRNGIRRASEYLYIRERDVILSHYHQLQQQESAKSIIPFLDLLQWVKTTTKRLDKRYKVPLMDAIDVPALFLEIVPPVLLHDLADRLQHIKNAQVPKPLYTSPADQQAAQNNMQTDLKDGEVMAIYDGVRELTDMHHAFCPK